MGESISAIVSAEGVIANVSPSVEWEGGDVGEAGLGVGSEEGLDDGVAGEGLAAVVDGGGVDDHGVAYGALEIGGETVVRFYVSE